MARKSLAQWRATAPRFARDFSLLLRQLGPLTQEARPSAKTCQRAQALLQSALQRHPLPSHMAQAVAGQHDISICVPDVHDNALVFALISGRIQARSRIHIRPQRTLIPSGHAIERLHQRLNTPDAQRVLQEVASGLRTSAVMREAARRIGAQHWPLLSEHGLFVCVPLRKPDPKNPALSTLITWMRFDHLSQKWGRIADDLLATRQANPQLLHDPVFCAELMRHYNWLLRPHAPGIDFSSLWWAAKPLDDGDDGSDHAVQDLPVAADCGSTQALRELEREAQCDESQRREHAEDLRAQPTTPPCAATAPHRTTPRATPITAAKQDWLANDAASASGSAAAPATTTPSAAPEGPILKPHSRHQGIVVKVQPNGTRVVSLQNGCFGVLRPSFEHLPKGSKDLPPRARPRACGAAR